MSRLNQNTNDAETDGANLIEPNLSIQNGWYERSDDATP